jgi:hypothetical protein
MHPFPAARRRGIGGKARRDEAGRQGARTGQHLVALPNAIAERGPALIVRSLELVPHFINNILSELLLQAADVINPRGCKVLCSRSMYPRS